MCRIIIFIISDTKVWDSKALGNILHQDSTLRKLIKRKEHKKSYIFTVSHIARNNSIFLAVCIPLYTRREKIPCTTNNLHTTYNRFVLKASAWKVNKTENPLYRRPACVSCTWILQVLLRALVFFRRKQRGNFLTWSRR
jgi:hypothetical protein